MRYFIKPRDKIADSRFPSARGPDNGDVFALRNMYAHTVKHIVFIIWIWEADIFKLDIAF